MGNTEHAGQGHCLRCGRRLTAASSITAGYGPVCRARIRIAATVAALADYTTAQLGSARELLADAAVIPTALATVFRTVSTDGASVYLTTTAGCTCPASKQCYHRAAVSILAAA
jgi:uncharacterized protein DUF6011